MILGYDQGRLVTYLHHFFCIRLVELLAPFCSPMYCFPAFHLMNWFPLCISLDELLFSILYQRCCYQHCNYQVLSASSICISPQPQPLGFTFDLYHVDSFSDFKGVTTSPFWIQPHNPQPDSVCVGASSQWKQKLYQLLYFEHPHHDIILSWFWHLIWKYIWHIFSDILFWHSIWHSVLTFYLAFILIFYLACILAFYFSKKTTWYMPYLMTFFLAYVSGISSDILPGILSGIDSSWLRSGGEHSDPVLAVEVRRGTLRSSACSWGPAEGGGGTADIKSNNPHLTGGEQKLWSSFVVDSWKIWCPNHKPWFRIFEHRFPKLKRGDHQGIQTSIFRPRAYFRSAFGPAACIGRNVAPSGIHGILLVRCGPKLEK